MKKFGGKRMKNILILGGGCARCRQVEENAQHAVSELAIEAEVSHVTDMAEIIEFGVMSTPALVIDQKVVCSGRIPGVEEIKEFLTIE